MEEEGGAGGEEDVKEAIPNHREALTAGTSNIICSPLVKQKSALLPVFITASLWWCVRHLMFLSGSARPPSGSRDPATGGMPSTETCREIQCLQKGRAGKSPVQVRREVRNEEGALGLKTDQSGNNSNTITQNATGYVNSFNTLPPHFERHYSSCLGRHRCQ